MAHGNHAHIEKHLGSLGTHITHKPVAVENTAAVVLLLHARVGKPAHHAGTRRLARTHHGRHLLASQVLAIRRRVGRRDAKKKRLKVLRMLLLQRNVERQRRRHSAPIDVPALRKTAVLRRLKHHALASAHMHRHARRRDGSQDNKQDNKINHVQAKWPICSAPMQWRKGNDGTAFMSGLPPPPTRHHTVTAVAKDRMVVFGGEVQGAMDAALNGISNALYELRFNVGMCRPRAPFPRACPPRGSHGRWRRLS